MIKRHLIINDFESSNDCIWRISSHKKVFFENNYTVHVHHGCLWTYKVGQAIYNNNHQSSSQLTTLFISVGKGKNKDKIIPCYK